MIVVIGSPVGRMRDGEISAAGMSSRIALAAARAGGSVQIVGKTGDDATADSIVLDLARGAVGHVALLRDATHATPLEQPDADDAAAEPLPQDVSGPAIDAADIDLGLRYLTTFEVVVVAEPAAPELVAVVADAAEWAGARMILIVAPGSTTVDALPADVIAFEAPDGDPDGAFADLVGSFAAALGGGTEPEEAFRAAVGADGWAEVPGD